MRRWELRVGASTFFTLNRHRQQQPSSSVDEMRVAGVRIDSPMYSGLPLKGVAYRSVDVVLCRAFFPVLSQSPFIAVCHELGNE